MATARGVRADGTLWAWGAIAYVKNGSWHSITNSFPTQLCRESNWLGFSDGLLTSARNRAGESWSLYPFIGIPAEDLPIADSGLMVSSNSASAAFGSLFNTDWTQGTFEVQSNGTLRATPWSWPQQHPPGESPRRFGPRSDWVSVWGSYETTIGLTSDGTLWTWGLDFGQTRHLGFGDRLDALNKRISEALGNKPPINTDDEWNGYHPQKEPRPLLRMAGTNSAAGSK
jgi:alpha-tubulin suppressor-like RCC1 family protein